MEHTAMHESCDRVANLEAILKDAGSDFHYSPGEVASNDIPSRRRPSDTLPYVRISQFGAFQEQFEALTVRRISSARLDFD